MRKRTIFAMKKIKEFNEDYFSADEQRILNPLIPGFFPRLLKVGLCSFNAFIFLNMYIYPRTFKIAKSLALVGCLVFSESLILKTPNLVNEFYQNFRRNRLAKFYLEIYGNNYFHDIINPNYNLEELRNLKNKYHAKY